MRECDTLFFTDTSGCDSSISKENTTPNATTSGSNDGVGLDMHIPDLSAVDLEDFNDALFGLVGTSGDTITQNLGGDENVDTSTVKQKIVVARLLVKAPKTAPEAPD